MKVSKAFTIAWAITILLFLSTSAWGTAGDQLWKTEFSFPNYIGLSITALSVAPTSIIVCGYAGGGMNPSLGFAKAFDLITGKLKWEQYLGLGSSTDRFTGISVSGGVALITGFFVNTIEFSKAVIRACNSDTGQLLWESQQDIYYGIWASSSSPPAPFLAAANNRTYLAVIAPEGEAPVQTLKCVVSAFQIKNVDNAGLLLLLDK